ncbi:hypothetical protein ACMDCR_10145 [Labrys okinawensis]|uniref:hypothetical protein n=1 Tax=Labrys okinawensis TaxID=346911 RepID=UPI0039BD52C3
MPPEKSAQVNLRLTPSLKARAEKAAERDHRSLTSLIEKLLADYLCGRVSLEVWHNAAKEKFERLALDRGEAKILSPRKYRTLSFSIHTADAFEFEPAALLPMVNALPSLMAGYRTQLFDVYTREGLAPYLIADAKATPTGKTSEILESAIFPDRAVTGLTDFWRVAPGGFATHIGVYYEDRKKSYDGFEPGTWFWPFQAMREVNALVLIAMVMAQRLEGAESVEFRCEWQGLGGRALSDAEFGFPWLPGLTSYEEERVTLGEWSVDDLKHQPVIVSELVGPLVRSFYPSFPCDPDWVGRQIALRR